MSQAGSITGGGGGGGSTVILQWNVVTAASNPVQIMVGNGYIPKGAGAVQFLLPAAAAIGDTFAIAGYGNMWVLNQNAGQSVIVGNVTSMGGVMGSVTATVVSDTMEMICVTANTEFKVIFMMGNPTII